MTVSRERYRVRGCTFLVSFEYICFIREVRSGIANEYILAGSLLVISIYRRL